MKIFYIFFVSIVLIFLNRLPAFGGISVINIQLGNQADTSRSILALQHSKKSVPAGIRRKVGTNPGVNLRVAVTHHLKAVKAYETDNFALTGKLPDSLAAVTLINFMTGETSSVYPVGAVADTAKPEFASANFPGQLIDMYSAAPNSFYWITAGGNHAYKISVLEIAGVLSVNMTDNHVGTMSMAAFSPALDTMRAPLRERIPDSLRARVLIVKLRERILNMGLDSLKLLVRNYRNDTLKAAIFNEIANRYMDYDTISNKRKRLSYQNNAVTYSTLAMQQYYKGDDTSGMRNSFDNMARVYYAQGKFSQAKWFILQSNTLSRGKSDVPNIIKSLIALAEIKSRINDYALAMKDLNEAMSLSVKHNYLNYQSEVLKNYGLLYSRLKNYPKEEIVLKKRDSIEAEIHKKEQDSLLATINTADSVKIKKIDSVQVKEKVFISGTRKPFKGSSAKKLASLEYY